LPLTLADGQSIPYTVTFLPQSSGTASASISFFSNATNSPATESLSGTGVAPVQHSVDLSWRASGTPGVVGYYVYRSTVSGGPYDKITPSPDPTLTYSDANVASGQTYYYVITAQDGGGMESTYSNQATVTVMTP
jgi:fibronectin type 3 domain-containing protein